MVAFCQLCTIKEIDDDDDDDDDEQTNEQNLVQKIFTLLWGIAVFMLGRFILTHHVYIGLLFIFCCLGWNITTGYSAEFLCLLCILYCIWCGDNNVSVFSRRYKTTYTDAYLQYVRTFQKKIKYTYRDPHLSALELIFSRRGAIQIYIYLLPLPLS